MFDIGFGELILVLVIGLVVLGPERLPVAVKTVAGWIRVMRSMAANVQNELTQELKLQELQDNLKKMEEQAGKAISPELKASMDELKKQLDPEALADQELEIPSVRPASAGTPASENPAPAAPSPAVAEEAPVRPSPEVSDTEPAPSPVTVAASDSQKH